MKLTEVFFNFYLEFQSTVITWNSLETEGMHGAAAETQGRPMPRPCRCPAGEMVAPNHIWGNEAGPGTSLLAPITFGVDEFELGPHFAVRNTLPFARGWQRQRFPCKKKMQYNKLRGHD